MDTQQILQLPIVTLGILENNLSFLRGADNFEKDYGNKTLKHINGEGWTSVFFDSQREEIIIVFRQDRMGGCHADPYEVYCKPTPERPVIPMYQINDFGHFVSTTYGYRNESSVVYRLISEYKKAVRKGIYERNDGQKQG